MVSSLLPTRWEVRRPPAVAAAPLIPVNGEELGALTLRNVLFLAFRLLWHRSHEHHVAGRQHPATANYAPTLSRHRTPSCLGSLTHRPTGIASNPLAWIRHQRGMKGSDVGAGIKPQRLRCQVEDDG